MRTIVVLNAAQADELLFESLPGGGSALSRCLESLRLVRADGGIVLLAPQGGLTEEAQGCRVIAAERGLDEQALLDSLLSVSAGFDAVLYAYADCPFLDPEICLGLCRAHERQFAEYTFADGYPYGIAPEIVSVQALPALRKLARPEPLKRDSLFTIVQRDINAFDIETELAEFDQRILRASLTCDTRRNFLLCSRLAERGALDAREVCRILRDDPAVLRTLPAYVSIQLTDGCPQLCSYCPYPRFGGDVLGRRNGMALNDARRLVHMIHEFCGDAVVNVSLWGEASLYEDFNAFASAVRSCKGLELLVETSGIGWSRERLEELKADGGGPLTWIVSLDSIDAKVYAGLRGDGFDRAVAGAEMLLELFPASTYVQAVRMNENEEGMEGFYRAWKKRTENIIIQKYDHFCGYLEQRKVADLSPLRRFPCWHLKRDLVVLLDGTVPLCREDVGGRHTLGNVWRDGFAEIWKRAEDVHLAHVRGEYPGLCGSCDEYYTYNH